MLYLLLIVSLFSIAINYAIYRKITTTVLSTIETVEPIGHYCQCVKASIEPIEAHEHRYPQANGQGFPLNQCLDCGYWNIVDNNPPKTQEAYSSWTNQKDIPWVPPVTPLKPIVKTPNRPPLARPDGFV